MKTIYVFMCPLGKKEKIALPKQTYALRIMHDKIACGNASFILVLIETNDCEDHHIDQLIYSASQ